MHVRMGISTFNCKQYWKSGASACTLGGEPFPLEGNKENQKGKKKKKEENTHNNNNIMFITLKSITYPK